MPIANQEVLCRAYLYADRLGTIYKQPVVHHLRPRCVTLASPFVCSWIGCAHVANTCCLENQYNEIMRDVIFSVKGIHLMTFEHELLFSMIVKKCSDRKKINALMKAGAHLQEVIKKCGVTYPEEPKSFHEPKIELFRVRKPEPHKQILPQQVLRTIEASWKERPLFFKANTLTLYEQQGNKHPWVRSLPITQER